MATVAPAAMNQLLRDLCNEIPGAEFGGIVGDKAHGRTGYHISRQDVYPGDYSISQYAEDREGDSSHASAFDLTIRNSATLQAVCRRLLAALKANDPRLAHVRAFNGTVNGSTALRWERSGAVSGTDDTHLWHAHVEVFRKYANDPATMANIKSVILGQAGPSQEDGEEKMLFLVRYTKAPHVFLSDGITARHIASEAELKDIQTLAGEGSLRLGNGGKVRVVGRKSLVGRVVGDVPAGFEDQKA